ncbi:MAG: hypothetical protein JNM69_08175 [Archangium sp.]|nr:hypothetical protein [Archangium sp.]
MAWDPVRQRVVLFGGSGQAGVLGDTWEWDGTTWTQRTPITSPPARRAHAMAWDEGRQRVIIFGGYPNSLADTWEWDGTTWLQRMPLNPPPPSAYLGLASDTVRRHVVLFGGQYSTGPTSFGTWVWDGTR